MLDVQPAAAPPCPLLRFIQQRFRKRRGRRGLVVVALLACVVVASPRPARGGALDALAPFDPIGSDPWLLDRWEGSLVPTALFAAAEPPSRGRGPWLGVGGGLQGSPGGRRRFFALVELGLPLDDVAGARAPAGEPGDGDGGSGASSPDGFGEGARGNSDISGNASPTAAGPDASGSAAAGFAASYPAAAPSSDARRPASTGVPVPIALEPIALEGVAWPRLPGCDVARSCDPAVLMPLARAVVAMALRVQGGQAELRRLDGMAARSRAAASLPEVRLGAGTSRDESLRLTPTLADPARFTRDGGRDLWLEARLTWRLDSAIFARDEIAIMRLRAQQREELARLVSEVLEALVAFERARLRLTSDLSTSDERDQARVVQFGALARLDVLTDGWFSRRLEPASGEDERTGRGTGAPARAWP